MNGARTVKIIATLAAVAAALAAAVGAAYLATRKRVPATVVA